MHDASLPLTVDEDGSNILSEGEEDRNGQKVIPLVALGRKECYKCTFILYCGPFFMKRTAQAKTKPRNHMKHPYLCNIVRVHFLRLSGLKTVRILYLFKSVQIQNTPVQVQNTTLLESLHQSKAVTMESTRPQTAINMV